MRVISLTYIGLSIIIIIIIMVVVDAHEPVRCFFIFGDSLSDSGNNNDLVSFAKANFLPYGMDFPNGPTGRFSNGKTTVDFIGEKLGLEGFIPPFPQSKDPNKAMKGVNYASGAAGILPETGATVGDRIRLDLQLENHRKTIQRLEHVLKRNTTTYLHKCLYAIWVGSNDWMLNYFIAPPNNLNKEYYAQGTPEQFADKLISKFTGQFEKLYQLGARKVALFGLHPLGCLPTVQLFGKCSDYINNALKNYNNKLQKVATEFTTKHRDLKISYINSFDIYGHDYSGTGTRVKNVACCGTIEGACLPTTLPCSDRAMYAHWDNAHPTEAVNKVLASRAFNAEKPTDATPMDISHLVAPWLPPI